MSLDRLTMAVFSPSFRPKVCGVGDHTLFLTHALKNLKTDIQVFTFQNDSIEVPDLKVRLLRRSFLLDFVLADTQVIFVQYTPLLWAPRFLGLSPQLILGFLFCRLLRPKLKIYLMAHELNYPVGFNLRGLTYGIVQWIQVRLLSILAREVCVTWSGAKKSLLLWNSESKVHLLPVGSNVLPSARSSGTEANQPHVLKLVYFGTSHPSHGWREILALLAAFDKNKTSFQFYLIGVTMSQFEKIVSEHDFGSENLKNLSPNVFALGRLPESEVSHHLSDADLVLCPFVDGISTRRGSFMAAISHGCPVFTTLGSSSDPNIPWNDISYAVPVGSLELWTTRVLTALKNPSDLKEMGLKAKAYYQANWEWKILALDLLRIERHLG